MNRLLIKIYTLIAFLFICNSAAFAAGPASVYKVRVSKFELFNGTSWITAFEGTSSTLDIASVSASSSAGSFLSGLAVPDGTYTQVRVTPSPTFTISGNDGTRYTTAAEGPNGGSIPTLIAGQQAEFTLTLIGGDVPPAVTTVLLGNLIIKDGAANVKVRVSFDVSGAIAYNAGADEIFPAVPTVTASLQ